MGQLDVLTETLEPQTGPDQGPLDPEQRLVSGYLLCSLIESVDAVIHGVKAQEHSASTC